MASSGWQQKVLPPEHGGNVSSGLLQHMSVCQTMDWELVRPFSRVTLGKKGAREAYTIGHGRDVLELQPGLVRAEYPMGETPQLAATSSNNS